MLDINSEELYRIIGENIYRFRVLRRMSQEGLAHKSNISTSYVSQIESFRLHKGITCTTVKKIAAALSVPPCILMTETPCPKYLQCLEQAALISKCGGLQNGG